MARSKKTGSNEVDVIAWAIRRIAGGHYAMSEVESGRELWVTELEPTLDQMEGELCHGPDDRVREPLLRLKECCNPTNVRNFFNVLLGEKLGEIFAGQFSFADLGQEHYPLVVAAGYRQLHGLISDLQGILARGREGVSVDWLANIEGKANPDAISAGIVAHYANEISHLFPKLIRRAEQLRIVPTEEKVPPEVRHYLEEASKCYIYGRFIACIIVCRSAIEFAIRDRLISQGQERALTTMKNQRSDSLWGLIDLARAVFPRELKPTLDDADEIRRAARDAVHVCVPKPEICKDMFVKTRGVLGELYSSAGTSRL